MFKRSRFGIVTVLALLACGSLPIGSAVAADGSTIPGTGAVSGAVTASKPFTAAQV